MKRLLFTLGVLVSFISTSFSQTLTCNNGTISFFQETSVEDIDGRSNLLASAINTSSNQIAYKVAMKSFKFEKSLMEDHFNENYVESGKYPYATYIGKINESIDWTKDGTYNITSTGTMTMHGVSKQITEKGILIIKGSTVSITNNFKIKFTDYNVEIPKLLIMQISDMVDVKVQASYLPKR